MLSLLLVTLVASAIATCPREPREEHTTSLRSPGDNGFKILVSGEPEKYVPGAVYTLSIVGSRTHGHLQQFARFMMTAEDSQGDSSPQRVGSFQLFGDALTTFNEQCVNTISEADDFPKTEVQVMWISPPKGSGCITFRSMVMVDRNDWYADDGTLSRQLCELVVEEKGEAGEEAGECCACDEAKYQLVFEGIWSNATHPKDFPFSLWLTHFSDVIGASHERNFSFWGEGQLASDGLRQVAEWGSVRGLELELRSTSRYLRTLIKAGGLWHPRVNTNTTSNFRVDQRRHLVSVVSMFGPSPDWIVGVSGLNLCLRDCTWAESRTIDLYPYDAGTDNGITYMSPNSPTTPQERIHRITEMYPEDPRAPFYDPTGRRMQPLARLYIRRESLIPRECDEQSLARLVDTVDVAENTEDTSRPECGVSDYTEWSACSVTCGKGLRMRQRQYLMPQKAEMLGCDRQLVSKEMCVADVPECPAGSSILDDLEVPLEGLEGVCATTEWGPLSECSETCGVGVAMRTRRFKDVMGSKKCPHVSLVEKDKCMGPPCSGGVRPEPVDPMCPVTEWTDWSPCSASCGRGVRFRMRYLLVAPEIQEKCRTRLEVMQQRPCADTPDCEVDMATAKQVCMLEPEVGPCRGYFERWYFEPNKGMCLPFAYAGCRGNRNNFLTQKECNDACGFLAGSSQLQRLAPYQQQQEPEVQQPITERPVDCVVSDWSVWTECSVTCGIGIRERIRMVKAPASNGGKPCPKRLMKRKKCHVQCN